MAVTPYTDFEAGIAGADVVMTLRLQRERMAGGFVPSLKEYHTLYWGLTAERLARCAPRCAGDAPRPDEPRRGD